MTTQTFAMSHAGTSDASPHAHHAGRPGVLRFMGHLVEMLVVMLAGMGLLTAVFGMPQGPIELRAMFMAATMTLPMVAWMVIRGHSGRVSLEMAFAMVAPLALLIPMRSAGIVSGDALLGLQHILMLPAMLGAMLYRRGEYGL